MRGEIYKWCSGGRDGAVIGGSEPAVGEEIACCVCDGAVEGFGHEHADSHSQVFEKRGGVFEAGGCGDEV